MTRPKLHRPLHGAWTAIISIVLSVAVHAPAAGRAFDLVVFSDTAGFATTPLTYDTAQSGLDVGATDTINHLVGDLDEGVYIVYRNSEEMGKYPCYGPETPRPEGTLGHNLLEFSSTGGGVFAIIKDADTDLPTPPSPPVITTNGGSNYNTLDENLLLEGTCDGDIDAIRVNGSTSGVTYISGQTTWSYSGTLTDRTTMFRFTAVKDMLVSGADSITITWLGAPADPIRITTDGGKGPGVDFMTNVPAQQIAGTCDSLTTLISVKFDGVALNVEHASGETLWSYPKSGDEFAPVVALAFQNEGTLATDVLSSVSTVDNSWSPADTVPVGTVLNDFYATGASGGTFDALTMEFDPGSADLSQAALRVYLQKGAGPWSSWEHYRLLPGTYNPTDQDSYDLTLSIDHYPAGELPSDTSVGWVDLPLDPSWTASDLAASGSNIGLTLRLWNWRVDAAKLVQLADISAMLVEGPNTFIVTSKDPSGAESTDSITITLDTVPPESPVITTDGGNGPGQSFYTSNRHLTLQGTGEAAAALIKVNGSTEGVTRSDGDTTWSYDVRLQDRQNTFVVTAEDEAGNPSPADTITITLGGILEGAPMSDVVPVCAVLILLSTLLHQRSQRRRERSS